MNIALLERLIERARAAATSPAEEMAIRDLGIDLLSLADTCADSGLEPCELAALPDDLKEICAHVAAQPFDICETDDDGVTTITDLNPDDFADWLATLERLAQ